MSGNQNQAVCAEKKLCQPPTSLNKIEDELRNLKISYESAYRKIRTEPEISLFLARKTAENLAKKLYTHFNCAEKNNGKPAGKLMLEELLRETRKYLPEDVCLHFENVQRFGNRASHDQSQDSGQPAWKISSDSVVAPMASLGYLIEWVFLNVYNFNFSLPELMAPHLLAQAASDSRSIKNRPELVTLIRERIRQARQSKPFNFDFSELNEKCDAIEYYKRKAEHRHAFKIVLECTKTVCKSLYEYYGFEAACSSGIQNPQLSVMINALAHVKDIRKTVIEQLRFIATFEHSLESQTCPDTGEKIEDSEFLAPIFSFEIFKDWFVKKYQKEVPRNLYLKAFLNILRFAFIAVLVAAFVFSAMIMSQNDWLIFI